MKSNIVSRNSNYVWVIEAIRRFMQLVLGNHIFDLPPLLQLRNFMYRMMFRAGSGLLVGAKCMFIVPHGIKGGGLKIGNDVKFNRNVDIDFSGGIQIGNDVWISQNVVIETHDHVPSKKPKSEWTLKTTPLKIEDGVWLGANAIVLGAVTVIGKGSVVAAGAVVTKDVGEYVVVGGIPARVIGAIKE